MANRTGYLQTLYINGALIDILIVVINYGGGTPRICAHDDANGRNKSSKLVMVQFSTIIIPTTTTTSKR